MKIALIGATGFIGSGILREALDRGHQVTGIARHTENLPQHPNMVAQRGDVRDEAETARLVAGHDAVISGYSPGRDVADLYHEHISGYRAIIDGVKNAGVKRLLVVGGAGSLEVAPGVQLVDTPEFPEQWKAGSLSTREVLYLLRDEQELEWNEILIDGIKIPVLGLFQPNTASYTAINFDLVASIYFHLVRIEELKYKRPDEIDDTVNQTLLYKYNRFHVPVVDIIINWFGKIIENILTSIEQPIIKKATFPNGEHFGLALTHDVDITRAINPIKRSLLSYFHRFHLLDHIKYKEIQESEENTWALDDLLDLYKSLNWPATFNFIARLTEGRSYRYNIASRKFKKLFKRLKTEGHEIGFHPSRDAFDHPRRYKKELNKLKRIGKDKIYGLRHHYLRCLFPQIWRVVQSLNLKYDCSLAYRRVTGFRAGTTKTFICFDHINQSELELRVLKIF